MSVKLRFCTRWWVNFTPNHNRTMSSTTHFRSIISNLTGEQGWTLEEDYKRDIARAGYADMLHDGERNSKYYTAITAAVKEMKGSGRRAVVLDIGAGTGLLSMMAVRAGADEVYACECFPPMYATAVSVIARNNLTNSIKLIPKRSTELIIGVDLPYRANILVTETFDTEVIGEHCIETYNHANRELMEPSSLSIPHSATLYAQLVSSPTLSSFHTIHHPAFTKQTANCPGLPSAHDLQLSKVTDFIPTTDILPIFKFSFTEQIPTSRSTTIKSESTDYTTVLFFFELEMTKTLKLSVFPSYYNEDYHWREHWIQFVHHVPTELRKNELRITQNELDYSLDMVNCRCGLHRVLDRSRIYRINDTDYGFYKSLQLPENVLFLGDDSLVPFHLDNNVKITGSNTFNYPSTDVKPSLILAEPHYSSSQSCIHDLQFFNDVKNYPSTPHLPLKAFLIMTAVSFKDLYKIRHPVSSTCGFNLEDFDEVILTESETTIEYHPVWEYDYDLLSSFCLFPIDEHSKFLEKTVTLPETTNGLVFHVEWDFGTVKKSNFDKKYKTGSRQAVAFTKKQKEIAICYSLESGLLLRTTPTKGVV